MDTVANHTDDSTVQSVVHVVLLYRWLRCYVCMSSSVASVVFLRLVFNVVILALNLMFLLCLLPSLLGPF